MRLLSLVILSVIWLSCSDSGSAVKRRIPTDPNEGVVIHPFSSYQSYMMRSFSASDTNRVNLRNWDHAPQNRWAYQHFRELVPTQNISRGTNVINYLMREPRKIDTITFNDNSGQKMTVRQMLDSSYTDGFIVLKDGKIVMEEYSTGLKPGEAHLAQSVSKSLTVALLAIYLQEGKIKEKSKVIDYLPQLKNTGYRDATVGSLMDMLSGVAYSFGNGTDDPDSDLGKHMQARGLKPIVNYDKGQRRFLTTLKKEADPNKVFLYKDCDAEVLGWLMEWVYQKPFALQFSERIWSAIGAEQDAYIACDKEGSPICSRGFSLTLRDMARIGQLYLQRGKLGNYQIIPAEFFDDIPRVWQGMGKFGKSKFAEDQLRNDTSYNNQFWLHGLHEGAFMATGIQGQYLYIHPKYNVVIGKFSSQPSYNEETAYRELNAFLAISRRLGRKDH